MSQQISEDLDIRSKERHTPGPWVWEQRNGDHPLNDQDGWGCDGLWAVNGGFILGSGQNWDGIYSPPNDANAALIAAAPETAAERDRLREINAELLAACEAAFEARCLKIDGSYFMDERDAIAVQLRAAIAKAKGDVE